MEKSPACSCPSMQAPDASTTFNLEAGIEPMLPDPCTAFKLEAGMEAPKLPEPEIKLEADMEPNKVPEACAKRTKLLEARTEPNPEPCEEYAPLSPPLAADDDPEITPLSGNHPFFTNVLSRSHIQKGFLLTIPTRFLRHLPEARVPTVLLCGGRSWTTSYCGDLKCKKFELASWREFAEDNRLRVGDACVFELIPGEEAAAEGGSGKALVFRVQVLRGDLPEEVTSRGATSDEPLLIVD